MRVKRALRLIRLIPPHGRWWRGYVRSRQVSVGFLRGEWWIGYRDDFQSDNHWLNAFGLSIMIGRWGR